MVLQLQRTITHAEQWSLQSHNMRCSVAGRPPAVRLGAIQIHVVVALTVVTG